MPADLAVQPAADRPTTIPNLQSALPVMRQYLTPNAAESARSGRRRSSSTTARSTTTSCRPIRSRSTISTPARRWAGSAPGCASSCTTSRPPGTSPVCRFYRAPALRRLAFLFGEPAGMRGDRRRASGRLDLRESERVLRAAAEHGDRRVPGGHPAGVSVLQRGDDQPSLHDGNRRAQRARRKRRAGRAEGYGPGPYYPVMCAAAQ